ncbi:hypothetical protein D3C86_2094460 [compost metagenome]
MDIVERPVHIGREIGAGKRGNEKFDRKTEAVPFGAAERGDCPRLGRVWIRGRETLRIHRPV